MDHFSTGAVVFDERIAVYGYDEAFPRPDRAVLGRAYITRPVNGTSSRDLQRIPFRRGPNMDIFEEVAAVVDDQSVVLSMAPKVGHHGLELRGTIRDDSVIGQWKWVVENDTIGSGAFEMWRVSSTFLTDSAILRSQRGRSEWLRDSPSDGESIDVAPVAAEPPSR